MTIVIIFQGTDVILPVGTRYGAFTGRGFVSLPADTSIAFLFSPPRDSQYEVILRFSSVVSSHLLFVLACMRDGQRPLALLRPHQ
jgi:hypothetical protein